MKTYQDLFWPSSSPILTFTFLQLCQPHFMSRRDACLIWRMETFSFIRKDVSTILVCCSFFFDDVKLLFLGPSENIWSSSCISDLAMSVVEQLFQAQGIVLYQSNQKTLIIFLIESGTSFLNKFWLCKSYNYLIFSSTSQTSPGKTNIQNILKGQFVPECSFFSTSCWILEAFFLLILLSLTLIIVLGNTFTVATLAMENKKTVYQFLQVTQLTWQLRFCVWNISDQPLHCWCPSGPLWTSHHCHHLHTFTHPNCNCGRFHGPRSILQVPTSTGGILSWFQQCSQNR